MAIDGFTILSASGEFALPQEMRGDCIFLLIDGSCIEYRSSRFKSDIANRHFSIRSNLRAKFGSVRTEERDASEIADFYKSSVSEKIKSENENMPIEQSRKEFLSVIRKAVEEGAVDVHWIVRAATVKILFRIHGRIERMDEFVFNRDTATGVLGAIYSDAKDASDQSFSPRNKSSCSIAFSEPPVAIRWQTVPTGDSSGTEYDVVLRVTKQDIGSTDKIHSLYDLGFLSGQCDLLEAACNSPGGIIMSGVTGSGKTTALRSLMQMARGEGDKKIYTVEDPIELRIFGATQINARGGNMSEILKGLLRADPDVVMVGEVRGKEVATVMQDVLRSGHKMMTTIHAASAFGIISRLSSEELAVHRETIVEPGFVAALVYQYLMPTICPHCRLSVINHPDRIEKIADYLFDDRWYALDSRMIYVRNYAGCDKCRKGIGGMTICAEVVRLNYEIIKLIRERKDAEALHAYRLMRTHPFHHSSMVGKTAYEAAIYKVSQGLIDPMDVNDMCGAMSLQEVVRGHYDN